MQENPMGVPVPPIVRRTMKEPYPEVLDEMVDPIESAAYIRNQIQGEIEEISHASLETISPHDIIVALSESVWSISNAIERDSIVSEAIDTNAVMRNTICNLCYRIDDILDSMEE